MAKGRFQIIDDLNVPKEVKSINYFGPDPFRIYSRIPPLLQIIFQVRGTHINEEDFRWDLFKDSDTMNFYFRIRLERALDRFTTPVLQVRVFGHQPKDPASPNGRMLIEVLGTMRTTYPVDNDPISRAFFVPFLWLYHYALYNNVRRKYLQMYAARIERFMNELRSILGIMQKPRLT